MIVFRAVSSLAPVCSMTVARSSFDISGVLSRACSTAFPTIWYVSCPIMFTLMTCGLVMMMSFSPVRMMTSSAGMSTCAMPMRFSAFAMSCGFRFMCL